MKLLFILFVSLASLPAMSQIKMAKVNGYDVEYELKGQGEQVILLEAGGSASLSDWDKVYERLSKVAKVLRYSRIGNGNSSQLKKNYSSEEYAHEATLLLRALNITEPVVYIAHSYGAYIGRVFAARYPKKLSALMLIEPASEHDVDIMRQIDLVKAEQEIAAIKLDDMKNGLSNQYLDFWAKRPLPDYPEIPDVPVTVIASVKKVSNPSVLFFTDKGRELWGELHTNWVNAFPQGRAVLTDRSGHYPQIEEPEMVIAEIIALLNRTKKGRN